jgi:hypothetical protein
MTGQPPIRQLEATPVIVKGFPTCISPPACAVYRDNKQHSHGVKNNTRNMEVTTTSVGIAINVIRRRATVAGSVADFSSM